MNLSASAKLRVAARIAFLAGLGTVVTGAYAQEAEAPADKSGEATAESAGGVKQLQGVQVTGSRIKQKNLTESSSTTVFSDKELRLQGTTSIESLINQVPQAFAGFTSADSNGATGTATVNLRGLGPQETLVLIDGKRLMPGDPLQTPPSADLNFVPAALVERVEILSGGASAVYGSDAVAGVVNFVMKKDFEGLRVDSQVSRTDHSDATTTNTTLVWGSNFNGGKGNVTLYSGFRKSEALTQDKRTFSASSVTTPASGDVHNIAGSRVIVEGRLLSYDRYYAVPQVQPYYGLVSGRGANRTLIDDDGRTYNFAPFNYLQRPDKRYNLGGFASNKINDHVEVYGNAMFMDDRSVAAVAPSGIFGTRLAVSCNNPLMSASQRDFFCDSQGLGLTDTASVGVLRRMPELGPRLADLRHTQYRINFGARGDISDVWSYDASAQRGEVIYQSADKNYVNTTNARAAVAAVDDGFGNAVCAPDAPAGCVPLDIFQEGGITAQQADFIRAAGYTQANLVEQVVLGTLNGDLGKYGITSPLAKEGMGVSFGVEYRTEALDYRPDAATAGGTLGGTGGPRPAVSGQFQVHEAFGEVNLPLVEEQPLVKSLSVDLAYRWSNYSLANDTQSYKYGLRYAPVDDLAFRASFQKATRAPAVSELFSPSSYSLAGGSDPCAGANLRNNPSAPTLAQCQSTGVTETQYVAGVNSTADAPGGIQDCNSGQCNIFTGGNTALRPEDSKTYSAGFVFTPTFVKNLTLTIDYFDIAIRGAIGIQPVTTIFNRCFGGDQAACDSFNRGGTGRLSGDTDLGANFIDNPLSNTAALRTKGVDFQADYRIRMRDLGLGDVGTLSTNFVATYLTRFSTEAGEGSGVYDCAGLFGTTCGTPNPEYRHKMRVTWDITPIGVALSANWRYFGEVKLDTNTSDPNLTNGRQNTIDGKIGAKQYLDLSGTYTLPTADRNVTLRFGISNVGGQNPPIVSSGAPNAISSPPFGNGNTFPGVYDSLGRVLFAGVTADF